MQDGSGDAAVGPLSDAAHRQPLVRVSSVRIPEASDVCRAWPVLHGRRGPGQEPQAGPLQAARRRPEARGSLARVTSLSTATPFLSSIGRPSDAFLLEPSSTGALCLTGSSAANPPRLVAQLHTSISLVPVLPSPSVDTSLLLIFRPPNQKQQGFSVESWCCRASWWYRHVGSLIRTGWRRDGRHNTKKRRCSASQKKKNLICLLATFQRQLPIRTPVSIFAQRA